LKNIFYLFVLILVIYSCNRTTANKKQEPVSEDSLQYYPPTPGSMSKADYRKYVRTLTTFFDDNLIHEGFNGSILVAKDGFPLYEKYVGFADLRKKDLLTDSTPMHIASTSKTFTAVAILRMVQENKLSLSDSIQKFFPGLPYPGITVKMLLSHRSGLPNYLYFMDKSKNWDKSRYATNNDMLQMLYKEKPAAYYKPGTHFGYCNTNFVLLSMIVEKIAGQPFPQYMQEHLFGPLQMTHTFIFTLADSARATHSFNYNRSVWDNDFLECTYGDKNVYSTPRDLLKWDQALYTEQVLNKAMKDSAFTPYSLEHPSVHNYGLGFRMLLLPNGKKVIYHFGRWHGFNSAFARLTDEKATIIILGNKFNRNIYTTAHKAYDIFGDYGQDRKNDEEDDNEAVKPVAVKTTVKKSTVKTKKTGKHYPSHF
jgi:CubicO group peptidase (beta-lactamase class C family)